MNSDKPLILVVDDEVHILHVVSLKLRNAGYDVVTAENGEEGLAVALERLPALVITDFQMPFMSGLELCQKMKESPATTAIPALMLTARGFSLAPADLEKTNIAGVLSKPFSPREVLARVQDLIGTEADREVRQTP
jgi:two-component system, OmpR family, alkaline phosphatase synthesis response regulator PhoP